MKVGDKVVCIDDCNQYNDSSTGEIDILVKGNIYTIKKIVWWNNDFLLHEAKAGYWQDGEETTWKNNRFRKVEPFKNKLTQELAIQVLTTQGKPEIEHIEIKEPCQ